MPSGSRVTQLFYLYHNIDNFHIYSKLIRSHTALLNDHLTGDATTPRKGPDDGVPVPLVTVLAKYPFFLLRYQSFPNVGYLL